MRVLTLTSLYPSDVRPRHGIFIEQRLRQFLKQENVSVRVVAPVPWFPLKSHRFGQYACFARTPSVEQRYGIDIIHPRYPLIPKIGMTLAPFFMAVSMLWQVNRILKQGYDFDIIDAHYFYPDGVAATIVGLLLNKPVVITARGSDLNVIPQHYFPRRMIQWAAARSAGSITVCQALKNVLINLGVAESKIIVLRNGVDLSVFSPEPNRDALREDFGLHGKVLLSVGNLISLKGHDLVIRALTHFNDAYLVIIGEGPEQDNLKRLAQELGVQDRLKIVPVVAQDELKRYYAAADVLILASLREGWANVLLESMACGTPVVATAVGGTPEVLEDETIGILVNERTPEGLVRAIKQLLTNYPERDVVRKYAERFDWDETSNGLMALFQRAISLNSSPQEEN